MSTRQKRRSPVYRQLEAYEEAWKREHSALQECWACEDTIAVGLSTYALVERVNQAWRDRVFRGIEAYCEEANQVHRTLSELWLKVTRGVLAWATSMREGYGSVEGLEELSQAERRVQERLAHWQLPRLSQAVGLREMTLSPEAAAELERIVEQAKTSPPPMPTRRLETRGPDFLLK